MSAIIQPAPAPSPDREKPPETRVEGSKRRSWLIWAIALVAALGVWGAYRYLASPSAEPKPATAAIRTVTVARGPLVRMLRVSGPTAARDFANVLAPRLRGPDSRRGMVLIKLAAAGSRVTKGQLLAQIDAQAQEDHIDDVNSTVLQASLDLKKRVAEQAVEWSDLEQTLRISKANAEKATLDASAAEVKTEIERELLKLDAEEAQAQYKQLQSELGFKKAMNQAEMRILEITKIRHELHRNRHKTDLTRFTIHAPIDGLVVMQQVWRGGQFAQVQQGDQLYPNQPFMKIVDTSHMQVEASINQTESGDIRVGQKARIGLDAFPNLTFTGRLYSIGALATRGWRENYFIRTIPVIVEIDGTDPRLIPDLSAYAEIELGRKENTLVVPLEVVRMEGGKPVVYVKKKDRFEKRAVQLGEENNINAEILSGLQAGDEVALDRPAGSS